MIDYTSTIISLSIIWGLNLVMTIYLLIGNKHYKSLSELE